MEMVEEEREFNLLILLEQEQNCGYVARKLYTQAASLEQLVSAIRRAFSIDRFIQISYFDTEYQSYVVPIDFVEIPNKGKIKVRDARGRRPTEEDLHSLLDMKISESSLQPSPKLQKTDTQLDSFLTSEELYQMLWTLLIVIANNLPVTKKEKRSSSTNVRYSRSKTATEMNFTGNFAPPEGPVNDFVSLVHTMAKIFPDANTRMVLNNVLQDYDLREQASLIHSVRGAKEWTRCVFSRVNEALHNTFDGEFNQHTLSTQDELAEFQATWFPVTDTNISEYKLEVNMPSKPKLQKSNDFLSVASPNLSQVTRCKSNDQHPRDRSKSFSFIAGEKFSLFANIPDEIVMCVFMYLDAHQLRNVYRVCSRWSKIAAEPFLWKRLFQRNWTLRPNWLGNWDVFIMYSGDNWMNAFDQWYYWELTNSLLNQEDSEDNIIYGIDGPEDDIMHPIDSKNLIQSTLPLFELKNEKEEIAPPGSTNAPILSTSPPTQIGSAPIHSQLHDKTIRERKKTDPGFHSGLESIPASASTWKMGKKRENARTNKDSKELRIASAKEKSISEGNIKIYRMSSYKISVGLIEEASTLEHEPSSLLPDIGILLPPCLLPRRATFTGFEIPNPCFQRPGGSQKTNYNIQRATLMKLLEYLTTPFSHDLQYMKIFMLTYIYFTTPQTLLRLLVRRYFIFPGKEMQPQDLQEWEERVKKPVKLRVFNILKFWLENYEMDFDEHLMTCMKEFAQKSLPPIMSKQILRVIVHKRSRGEKHKTVSDYQFNAAPPYPDVPKNIFSQTLQLWDISDLEISRQLTIIEFNLFSVIRPRELLNQSWKHPKRKKISPNIMKMLARFQDLSGKWVPQMIERAPLLKQKVKVLKRFINIAMELMKLNNFHDAMAILQGIKIQCEIRYHAIWEDLPNKFKKDYRTLEDIMNYEEQYKEHLPKRHPCIPHLDYHLKKLVAVEALVPSAMGHMVNFTKCRYVYNVISELIRFQQTPYNLQPVTQIADLLCNFDEIDDTGFQGQPIPVE